MEKKRVLLLSDTPTLRTGLGRICREVAKRFFNDYDVAVAGWHHMPLPHEYPYFIYPIKKGVGDEVEQVITVTRDFNPDILLAIGDIWDFFYIETLSDNYKQAKEAFNAVLWVTVDGEWTNPDWIRILKGFDNVASFSHFGLRELVKYGLEGRKVIYPGIDHEVFYPFPDDYNWSKVSMVDVEKTFICLVVGQNCDRKNMGATIDAFAEFSKDKTDVLLFMITNPTDPWGHNLVNIMKQHDLGGKAIVAKNIHPRQGISDIKLNFVYNMGNCIINSAIGEGASLTLFEAQAADCVPIAPNYSATSEVVSDRGKIIDVAAKVYGQYDVKRAFISHSSLVKALNELYKDWRGNRELIRQYNERGRLFVKNLTWDKTADELRKLFEETKAVEMQRVWIKYRIVLDRMNLLQVIPSWGKNCGIAEYTKELGTTLEAQGHNIAIFPEHNTEALLAKVQENRYNTVIFQHEYSFWQDRFILQKLLRDLRKKSVKTIIEMHSYSPLRSYNDMVIEEVDEIVVHCDFFKQKLCSGRELDNIHVVPMGCKPKVEFSNLTLVKKEIGLDGMGPVVGSFGFLRGQKGYKMIIHAVERLLGEYPNARFLLVAPKHEFGSDSYDEDFFRFVETIGMDAKSVIVREYMPEDKLLQVLSCTDLFVLNYKESPAGGGNSAAVKTLLRTQRPVIVSDTLYFLDLDKEVHKISGDKITIDNIKGAIKEVYENKVLAEGLVQRANDYLEKNSWENIAKKHLAIYSGKIER
jgi:glycosyltransferase involved in cell wall biosynthesis